MQTIIIISIALNILILVAIIAPEIKDLIETHRVKKSTILYAQYPKKGVGYEMFYIGATLFINDKPRRIKEVTDTTITLEDID